MATLLSTGRLAVLLCLFATSLLLFFRANQIGFLNKSHTDDDKHFAPSLLLLSIDKGLAGGSSSLEEQQEPDNKPLVLADASTNVRLPLLNLPTLPKKKKPLNIMILYPDDWRHDSIGAAKTQPVFTPFLDSLANDEGMRFTHNCVTTSVCWISRATLFTGQYWSRHKSEGLNRPIFYEHWNQTWPYLLQKHGGYYTGHIGKWQYHHPEFVKKHYSYARVYEGFHWIDTKQGTRLHATDMTRNDTLDFLRRRPKDRPFAVTVAFYPPKAIGWGPKQWFPKKETKQLYQNMTIPEPVDWNTSYYKLPEFFRRGKNEGRMRWKQRFGNYTLYQNSMKSYYALITQVDDACREIVNELKKQGILDETLLIFTTDNGFFHGEHGLAGKWFPYQESIRVPLIIRDPRMPTSKIGTLDDSFTLNVDLAPTILGAAHLTPPPGMQGRDIAELYLGPSYKGNNHSQGPWRDEFFYEHPSMGRLSIPASSALVRKQYKYMYYKEHKVERLFDLIKDPLENDDIKNLPEHAQLLIEMQTRYNELMQQVI